MLPTQCVSLPEFHMIRLLATRCHPCSLVYHNSWDNTGLAHIGRGLVVLHTPYCIYAVVCSHLVFVLSGRTCQEMRTPHHRITINIHLLISVHLRCSRDCHQKHSSSSFTIKRYQQMMHVSTRWWWWRCACRELAHSTSLLKHWKSNHGDSTQNTWCGFKDMRTQRQLQMNTNRSAQSATLRGPSYCSVKRRNWRSRIVWELTKSTP